VCGRPLTRAGAELSCPHCQRMFVLSGDTVVARWRPIWAVADYSSAAWRRNDGETLLPPMKVHRASRSPH